MLKCRATRAVLLACSAGALGLAGCGSSASTGSSSGSSSGSPPSPQFANLPAYKRRCDEMTKQGAWAHVVYPSTEHMTRGDTSEVNAAVTLNLKAPATEVLHSSNAVPAKVIVTCVISARLSASSYDFSLSDTRWIQRSFESMDTARWQWFVGPKVGGTQDLVLSLRPVVQLEQSTANVTPNLTPGNADIASYLIRARVSVPLAQRIPEMMSSLAADFRVAQGLVEAATALVVAIVGFGAAIGVKRLRRKRRKRPPPSAGKPLPAE